MTFESGAPAGGIRFWSGRARGRKQLRGSHTKRVHGRTAFERPVLTGGDGYIRSGCQTIAVAGLVAVGLPACATKGFVRNRVARSKTPQGGQPHDLGRSDAGADEEERSRHQRRRPESAGGGERGESGRSSRPTRRQQREGAMRGRMSRHQGDELDKASKRLALSIMIRPVQVRKRRCPTRPGED